VFRNAVQFVRLTAYPWCKDHIVSVLLLLTFPIAIGVYYGSRPEAEPSPLPGYLNAERNAKTKTPLPPLPKVESAKVAPGVSANPEFPRSVAQVSEDGDALPPLPIAVDHPKPISRANEPPTLAWPGLKAAGETPTSPATKCVWLTGSIEEPEAMPALLQNASRVHELTMPSRN
jgi:hypothetical protein